MSGGVERAARRLALHRLKFKYTEAFAPIYTRQQRRRDELIARKRERQAEAARIRAIKFSDRQATA